MTIQNALIGAIKKLRKTTPSANLDAEVLLAHILNKPAKYLLSHQDKKITPPQLKKFNFLIAKRQRGTPVAYLTHHKEFYKLDFYINEYVLVPRPDTEILVEETIKAARELVRANELEKNFKLTIADVGTGCGCLAITLAKYMPQANLIATDISEPALRVAKKNARRHKVLNRLKFKHGNLLKPLKKFTGINIITANLPYLTKNELCGLKHEPRQALHGGKLGLEIIEKLIIQASELKPLPSAILLEISPNQIKALDYFAERHFPGRKSYFVKDLSNQDRVAIIK